jgi:hypothetical protein
MGLFELLRGKVEDHGVDELVVALRGVRGDIPKLTKERAEKENTWMDEQVKHYTGAGDEQAVQVAQSKFDATKGRLAAAIKTEKELVLKIIGALNRERSTRIATINEERQSIIKEQIPLWNKKLIKARAQVNAIVGYIIGPVDMGSFGDPELREFYNSELEKSQKALGIDGDADSLESKKSKLSSEAQSLRTLTYDDIYVEGLLAIPKTKEEIAREWAEKKNEARDRLSIKQDGNISSFVTGV